MKKIIAVIIVVIFWCVTPLLSRSQKASTDPAFVKSNQESEMLFAKALQLYDEGAQRKSRVLFMQAAEKDPSNTAAYLFCANTARSNKEFVETLAKAKADIYKASEWDKLYYQLQETFLTGNVDKRFSIAQQLATMFPTSARAQVELGNTYFAKNDISSSRQAYEKAISLDAGWVSCYYSSAASYAFFEPKDAARAEQYEIKAAEISPKAASVQVLLGDVFRAQKNLLKARDAYTAAIALEKEEPMAYYKRGHANTYLGKYRDARTDYTKAGELDGDQQVFSAQCIAYTYLYDNDPLKAYDALMAKEAKIDGTNDPMMAQAKYNLLNSAAYIAFHTNDAEKLKVLLTRMEPLSTRIGKDGGTSEAVQTEKANMLYWKAVTKGISGDYEGAEQTAQEMKTALDPINDPRKLET